MKNQYFGDINDYRKYGLLRTILNAGDLKLLTAWMLTPDDGSPDGGKTDYFSQPGKWSKYDSRLFYSLKKLMASEGPRQVALIEKSHLLGDTGFYSKIVPDSAADRDKWFQDLVKHADEYNIVFMDPDSGLEIQSKRYGTKYSSKYLYWRELRKLWELGKSLLIYQHFSRKKRSDFMQSKMRMVQKETPGARIIGFATANVFFILALQSCHTKYIAEIITEINKKWSDQIRVLGTPASRREAILLEQYAFFQRCRSDFKSVQDTIELLARQKDQHIRYALLRDIVVKYSRPFSESRGILIKKHVWKPVIPENLAHKLHLELIRLRNHLFAYSIPGPGNTRIHSSQFPPAVFESSDWNTGSLETHVEEIKALVKFMEDKIQGNISKVTHSF